MKRISIYFPQALIKNLWQGALPVGINTHLSPGHDGSISSMLNIHQKAAEGCLTSPTCLNRPVKIWDSTAVCILNTDVKMASYAVKLGLNGYRGYKCLTLWNFATHKSVIDICIWLWFSFKWNKLSLRHDLEQGALRPAVSVMPDSPPPSGVQPDPPPHRLGWQWWACDDREVPTATI